MTEDELRARETELRIELLQVREQLRKLRTGRRELPLEQRPIDELDLPGLLARRRALDTTSYTPARKPAIEARKRELDALLVVPPRDYGALRASLRQVAEWSIDLGASDLSHNDRRELQGKLARAWARGMSIVARITALGDPDRCELARGCALRAWQALTRASDERIRLTSSAERKTLEYREYERWSELYREYDLPWPGG